MWEEKFWKLFLLIIWKMVFLKDNLKCNYSELSLSSHEM